MQKIKRSPLSLAVHAAVVLSVAMTADAVVAQQEGALEEVMVTARKRSESVQEIPVSLSVFSADDIQAADLRSLEDISDLTPGFQFQNQGNQEPGRYNTQLQFRGLTTAQFSPSFATGALFIDGIYVLNGGTSLNLMDLERVEVIKGPQAAYFGRNTFGGAVNLITRDPDMQELGGELNVRTTSRLNNDYSAFIEAPLIENVLSASLSGRFYDKRGHWRATDGGRMGNEETQTINAALKWNATEALQFKLRYSRSDDSDGAPAQGFVSGLQNDTCSGRTIQTAEGPAQPQNYMCGTVPYGNGVVNLPSDLGVISSQTALPGFQLPSGESIREFLLDQPVDVFGNDLPGISDIGLERRTERLSIAGSYVFDSGYTVDVSFGRNEQNATWIRDFDGSDRINFFSSDPQTMTDESYEIRISSPQDQGLRWLVGYNRYEQEFAASGSSGNAVLTCFSSVSAPLSDAYPENCIGGAPGAFVIGLPNSFQNSDEANVEGWFAALDYDITDSLTLSLEGRMQKDTLTKGGGLFDADARVLEDSFEDFLPRVILRWTPSQTTNVWASYSEGLIAGDFNVPFINADEQERAQFVAQDSSISEALGAETLEAWEIGLKQAFAGGRGQVNIAAFHYTWENIKGRSTFAINETCRASEVGTLGCTEELVGQRKQQVIDGEIIPVTQAENILIPGNATITGVELELSYSILDSLRWNLNGSWINAEYDDYLFNFVAPFAGFSQMAGNQTPRQPEWSGNTSLTYDFAIGGYPSYARVDAIYQGEAFIDESNLAKIEDYVLVNLRAGVQVNDFSVEAFVSNLTDEAAWATGARWTDFSSPTQFAFLTAKQGMIGSPLDKREVGIRLNYRF